MTVTMFIGLTSFLCTLFVCRKKRLFAQESAFVWLGFVPVFTTAFDAATPHNSTYFVMTKDPMLFLSHRIMEFMTIPLILLLFLDAVHTCTKRWSKFLTYLACYAVLYGLELICVKTDIFHYVKWKPWWSLIVWALVLLYVTLLQKGMRKLLFREAVRP